jgi:threonine/homoserine/homoserine lactone efflux protein
MNQPASLSLIFASSFALALSGAMMPGPTLAVTIRESARRGFWAGPLVTAGHGLVEILVVVAIFAGLGKFFQERYFIGTVGVVGGAALVSMAVEGFRELPRLTLSFADGDGISQSPFKAGIVTSVTNPYFIVWWATAGLSGLTLASGAGVLAPFAFFAGHILGDLAWYAFVSALVHHGRSALTDKRYRILAGTMGAVLFAFGSIFFIWGGMKLAGV